MRIEILVYLTGLVQDKAIGLVRLKKIVLGAGVEKTKQVMPAPSEIVTNMQRKGRAEAARMRHRHGR